MLVIAADAIENFEVTKKSVAAMIISEAITDNISGETS